MSHAAPTSTHAPADRRSWIALAIVLLGFTTIVLDSSIVNVALPSIQRELHFSGANLTWVVNAFLLTFGSLLLLGGRLGDLYGRKRVFLGGLALFTIASLWCGLAQDATMLVIARLAQGAGGAIASAVVLALIVSEFRHPGERATALAAYMFTAVAGGSLGLLVGGVLVELLDWRWMFFVNLPICALALVLGSLMLERDEGIGAGEGVDVLGSLLVTLGLMAGVYAIVGSSDDGWGSVRTLGCGGLSLVLLAAFLALEARIANPIVPLRIFRLRSLIDASVVRGLLITGLVTISFFGTLFLRHVLHYGALETGLAFLPMSVGSAVLSFGPGARLCARVGERRAIVLGFAAIVAALALLATAGEGTGYVPVVLAAFVLVGVASGATFPPLLAIAMSEVPPQDAGLASGIVSVSLELSAALGLAFVATFATDRTQSLAAHGATPLAALVGGYRLAFAIAVGLALAGLLSALVLLRPSRARPSSR